MSVKDLNNRRLPEDFVGSWKNINFTEYSFSIIKKIQKSNNERR